MTDTKLENQINDEGYEANVPGGMAGGSSIPKNKLKEYGKHGLAPLTQLAQKYQGELGPYLSAISKAFNAGAESLKSEEASETEKSLSRFFSEASVWFENAKEKLGNNNNNEIFSFIEDEGQKHPGMLFSASYLAGIFLGRVGRHLGRDLNSGKSESTVH